ncbi:MAG: hypothetical protein A2X84_08990 [Desulfuromonadaceae bacterium GWC2_58_13]|nr:MAG: hypothetical protein A2X84_08990 [Desulfuromonadaceae bacterium GWC2_58_13]
MKTILLALLCTLGPLSNASAQTCQSDTIVASTPTERFTDHEDGTVTDTGTGLTWKVCSEGQSYNVSGGGCDSAAATYPWQGALQQAAAVNVASFAGQSDWRLPNQKELNSIIERQCIDPAINLEVFPSTPSDSFRTASPYAGSTDSAWLVYFYNGYGFPYGNSYYYFVRLVRGGQ